MAHDHPHLVSLRAKHGALAEQVAAEEARPAPDATKLHELKKQKLSLKDAIAAFLRDERSGVQA